MPPREFKDPLWPEPAPDLWMGRSPLAPWRPPVRKPAPPMPPVKGTKEEETYLVDPELHQVPPPKGDVQTGQPIGPAFTKLPRDAQREAVNSAFNQVKSWGANFQPPVPSSKLPNLPKEWLKWRLRQAPTVEQASQGNIPLIPGIVTNIGHPVFQRLSSQIPRFAGALKKMRPETEYLTKPPSQIAGGRGAGVTSSLTDPEITATLHALGALKEEGGLTVEELARLASRGEGATLQSFPPRPQIGTALHEGYHAIYAGKNPLTQQPNISEARAQELMNRVLRRSGTSLKTKTELNNLYSSDYGHGLVEALARYQAAKQGGMHVH